MQTFLPYPDIRASVQCLDRQRLGKQRVEAMQILNVLTGKRPNSGWRHHPAVKMWKGCEEALKLYMNECIQEWIKRGYKNTMKLASINYAQLKFPSWFGNKRFHASHRAALLAKDPGFYGKEGWAETPKIDYIWGESNGK